MNDPHQQFRRQLRNKHETLLELVDELVERRQQPFRWDSSKFEDLIGY